MAAGRFVVPPYFPARDRDFNLLSGALLYVYLNETTTKANIYTDEALTVLSSNPVVANSSGQFPAIYADAGTEAVPVLYSVSVTTSTGASPGNPFNFDNYRPSVDWETATLALAEAAADAAAGSAAEAAADLTSVESIYDDILAIEATGSDAPAIAARALRDGSNLTGSEPASFLSVLGGVSLTALAASAGSLLVGFLQAGVGAVTRTLQARLQDTVSAFDFIPVSEQAAITAETSTYNATSALQAALSTGKTVEFPAGNYKAVGLTVSNPGQRLVALGAVSITKNGNGVILSSSAGFIELNGITFRGDAPTPTFTGDNISLTGIAPRIINCGSLWAYGRALKATGDAVLLIGSNPIWQTADTTGSGYDIEMGVSGTATLYQQVEGYYSSQTTGGILLTDAGSFSIRGGQFGKMTVASGTAPAGSNGGMTVGARITGAVTVNLSNASFGANQFSAIVFTAGTGTSGITVDRSNVWAAGSSYVNNGNANNSVVRDGGVSSVISFKYGPDGSLATESWDPATGDCAFSSGNLQLPTNKGVRMRDGTGTQNMRLSPSGSNLELVNAAGATQIDSAGVIQMLVGGVENFRVSAAGPVINVSAPPANAAASGTAGTIAWDASYIYVCTATNTWKRVAIATW